MKFNFKVITSVLAVMGFCLAMTAVIAMDGNLKKVPSQADTSVSLESIDSTEDTQNITIKKEEIDVVTSIAPEAEEPKMEEPKIEFTEEELAWLDSLMANVEVSLNVRAEASMEAEVVGSLRKGDRATVIEAGSEWTKIRSGKVEGYVNNTYCLYGLDALSYAKQVCETVVIGTTEELKVGEAITMEEAIAQENARQEEERRAREEAVRQEEERRAREEAVRQEEIKNSQTNNDYAATIEEVDLLAALIHCEAGGEPYEAQLAVGAVVMNRLERGIYGSTLADVIYQPGQFTPACDGKVNTALQSGNIYESCYQAAREALAGADNTNGAIYFRDNYTIPNGIYYGVMVFYHVWQG